MKIQDEVTICTVCTDDDILVEKNIEIISKQNKSLKINWIIVLNKEAHEEFFNHDKYSKNVLFVRGLSREFIGSIALHHSIGLNISRKFIKTRKVIFIDPDFFLLKKNIIYEIFLNMRNENLSLYGTTWHPKWFTKYRYFPCSHCLFVDLDLIDINLLDFRPIRIIWDKKYSALNAFNYKWSIIPKIIVKILSFNKTIQNFVSFMFFKRTETCFDGDTSHRIFLKKNILKNKYKCFIPYFDVKNDWLVPIPWSLNNIIEIFLPERLCYFPKNRNFVKFNDKLGDYVSSLGYESFFYNDSCIGFHIRGHPKRMIKKRNKQQEASNLEKIYLNNFI